MSYEVTRRLEWDMAHRIPLHGGRCQHLHGHRYAAEITCTARELNKQGFVIDFGRIKELVGEWIDRRWDHNTCYQAGDKFMKALRETAEATWEGSEPWHLWYEMVNPPTAENLARDLWYTAEDLLKDEGIKVVRVDLWETPNCRARYEPEEEPVSYDDLPAHPSFEDPSIFGIKKLLEKEKAEYDENGWKKEEGVEARPVEPEDRGVPGQKVFMDPFDVELEALLKKEDDE